MTATEELSELVIRLEDYSTRRDLEELRAVILTSGYTTGAPVTYKGLCKLLHRVTGVNYGHMSRQLSEKLSNLIALDESCNRALASAMVVNSTTGMPGAGFFSYFNMPFVTEADVKAAYDFWRKKVYEVGEELTVLIPV